MWATIKGQLREGKTFLQFGFLRTLGQGLGMVAPIVVAKFFAEELFASYSLMKMVAFFLMTFLVNSSQGPFIVFGNQERRDTGKINHTFSAGLLFFVVGIIAGTLAVVILGRYIARFADVGTESLWVIVVAFWGIAGKTFFCNLFMGLNKRLANAGAEFVYGLVTVGMVVGLQWMGKLTLETVFLIYPAATIVLVVCFVKGLEWKILLPLELDRDHIVKMLNFIKWVIFGGIAVYLINWGDNLVLRGFVSMKEIGDYNLGYQFFKGVVTLEMVVVAYFLPFVSEHIGDVDKIRNYLYNKRMKITGMWMGGAVVLFFVFPPIFRGIYDASYPQAVLVFRVLLVASIVPMYAGFYNPVLNALKKYRVSKIVVIIQVVMNLALDVALVPFYGVMGAVVATFIAYVIRLVLLEVYFRRILKPSLGL